MRLIKPGRKLTKYILDTFKYREYAENFSKKIKKAIKELDLFPKGYEVTGYVIEGLSIYYKPYSTYLIFFVVEDSTITVIRVLKDRMYWQSIIKKMQKINRKFLLQSSRFGEALRIVQDKLDSKNFYAFNPVFDRCKN